jgi:hypothetical protein
MEITLRSDILNTLTYRAVLAYVAVSALGDGEWTTAQLASMVKCNSSLMGEGLQELSSVARTVVDRASRMKWKVGSGSPDTTALVVMDERRIRRREFTDDLKMYWEHQNKGVPFAMTPRDCKAVDQFLRDNPTWERRMWQRALNNRFHSVVNRSQQLFSWVPRLVDYFDYPLDAYGKPRGENGKHEQAATTEAGNRLAREQAIAKATK